MWLKPFHSPVGLTTDTHGPILSLKVVLPVIAVDVGEVQPILRQGHCSWVTQHCLQVGDCEQEDDAIEQHHMDRSEYAVRGEEGVELGRVRL